MPKMMRKYPVPAMVAGKANAAGEIGRKWLDGLDELVDMLTEKWNIRVEKVLNGGSHALVCSAEFLHGLTGVETQAILEWGFLQMVSTALILLQIGEDELGREMLSIAEAWCA